ncbi:MAG: CvpA family protein [Clostridia bacterium]|nr:CvpA family protein [Clostridia bacterium]
MDPIKVDFSGKGRPTEVIIPPEKKVLKIIIAILLTIIGGAVAYYFMLPALNFKSLDFYYFIGVVIAIYVVSTFILSKAFIKPEYIPYVKKRATIPVIIGLVFALVLGVGYLTSCELFRAKAYSEIIDVKTENFGENDKSITTITSLKDFSAVPMIDKEVAENLANKKLGELSEYVSQFVIDSAYSTQINYKGNPYRIFPLKYGDVFKWFNNTRDGIPAYIAVNMYTQEANTVILKDEGLNNIKVSTNEYFNEKLNRVLRFNFPTYMFGTPSLEIDESGKPWWVCEVVDKTVGLIGGTDVIGVVLVDAADKNNIKEFSLEEIRTNKDIQWIDQIYSDDLLVKQYNYFGKYNGGFINAYIGQSGVVSTTEGSSYIASGDDVWLYTGVTSVTSDDSIVGFAIINQRTKEAVFQRIAGTTESGAQKSAESIVSDKGWKATFPVLLNVDGEATYFMALKDNSVVKSFAMVSVERVQDAVRSEDDANPDIEACLKAYVNKVKSSAGLVLNIDYNAVLPDSISGGDSTNNNGDATDNTESTIESVTGVITDIRTAVENGNSVYYIALDGKAVYYSMSAVNNNNVVILNVGDTVTITYKTQEGKIIPAKTIK